MSKIIGLLLLVAGIGYVVDGFGAVLSPGYSLDISRFTFVGEAMLIFWLLIKGSRIAGGQTKPHPDDRLLSVREGNGDLPRR